MMARQAPSAPAALPPLLMWRERAAIDDMNDRREALKARIAGLPACSHRRVILQAQLEELTRQALAAELKLRGGGS